jgi:hypothetical protein
MQKAMPMLKSMRDSVSMRDEASQSSLGAHWKNARRRETSGSLKNPKKKKRKKKKDKDTMQMHDANFIDMDE